jgi:hypothetical protein
MNSTEKNIQICTQNNSKGLIALQEGLEEMHDGVIKGYITCMISMGSTGVAIVAVLIYLLSR